MFCLILEVNGIENYRTIRKSKKEKFKKIYNQRIYNQRCKLIMSPTISLTLKGTGELDMDLYAQVILSNSQKISIHCCSYLLFALSTTNRLYLSLRSMTNQVLLQTLKKMKSFRVRQGNRLPKDLRQKDRTLQSSRLMNLRELKKRSKNIPLIQPEL